MMGVHLLATIAVALASATASVSAFAPFSMPVGRRVPATSPSRRLGDTENLLEGMSDERKSNLFQSLLRDLQIEGVPLLGCDANQVSTLNAAIWTTMAELGDSDEEQRACLVLEEIPVSALMAFAEDFTVLKTQARLMDYLPELRRFSVSVLGRGVGPALIVETEARTDEERTAAASLKAVESTFDQDKTVAALKSFIGRVVVGLEACPYTKSVDVSAVGLEQRGVTPGPVGYRYSPTTDACMAMSMFWNCICEMMSEPETNLSSIMLSLPGIGMGDSREAHNRFAAVVELVGRYLCLFRGDGSFGLVHFHPAYDRSIVHPLQKPSYGHLPPVSWLRPILKMGGAAADLSDDDLALSNYQRRAPHTAINILRMTQVNAAAGSKSIVDLDLGEGRTEKASGITLYTRNTLRMAEMGKDALQSALDADIAMQS
mmetsp:Transcript_11677/g.25254  ORF Transcript_11677/g.25254 Transcript_11677/m.25254 type:complete len:431 (-) Transcript_11677:99-1391(-)|eukprot:CAMPEP_0172529790 /NCGR_PEP_ID=MMETSP1067-20121228/3777_1 /TAXON_ID=265564 ORGANISM="Thalassiosira punctigera, Strain Tpunct2005C2" /NCGR_SAMPLE_ID=MMETSP1067 /ASSEMBLY_ACC=CAM_ASM_000444 /LENGTH=430 /DNA_ID=CAMNT_0013313913 /DNA_START=199 /DNA_END=1491 /DNA_ORIENTATION=-